MIIRPSALAARWPTSRPSFQPQLPLPRRHGTRFTFSRNFHPSRPHHHFTETSMQYAHHTFQYMHDFTGLPWGLSIPLTAILLRTCFSLLTQYPIVLNQRRLEMSTPLREAYRNADKKSRNERAKREGTVDKEPAAPISDVQLGGFDRLTMLLSRHFRFYRYIGMLPLIYVPVWWSSWNNLARICTAGRSSSLAEPSADLLASQSSLASEGLLWFPDLTASDPILLLALWGSNLANAAFPGVQDFKLSEPFAAPNYWQEKRIMLFRTVTFIYPVLVTSLFARAGAPAAVTLFCIFSSLTALITRSIFKRFVSLSKPLIPPARPRSMQQRNRITDEHGHHHYAESRRVPREWDDVFMQRLNGSAPPSGAADLGTAPPATTRSARLRAESPRS